MFVRPVTSIHYTVILLSIVLSTGNLLAQADEYEKALSKGNFDKKGKRVGIWEFYETPNDLNVKYDFDNEELIYIKPDSSQFIIKENDLWVKSRLTVPCTFKGNLINLRQYYDLNFFHHPELFQGNSLRFTLVFEVNEKGVAENPQVLNDPGFGIKEELLKAFSKAPNSWIAGMKNNHPVVSRLSIDFIICTSFRCTVPKKEFLEAKLLFAKKMKYDGLFRRGLNDIDFTGLKWSPDDEKIFLTSAAIDYENYKKNLFKDFSLFIIDVTSNEQFSSLYRGLQRAMWLNKSELLLTYGDAFFRSQVKFDVNKKTANTLHDSITYFHISSKDKTKLAFLSYEERYDSMTLWELNLSSNHVTSVKRFPREKELIPISYSPDGSTLLLEEFDFKAKSKNLLLLRLSDNKKILSEIPYSQLSGWSADGKVIYLNRFAPNVDYPVLTIYALIVETNKMTEVLSKMKQSFYSEYSAASDLFLVMNDKGETYLMKNIYGSKPELLIKDTSGCSWSNDGQKIAYINKKENQLYVVDVLSKISTKLTNWATK